MRGEGTKVGKTAGGIVFVGGGRRSSLGPHRARSTEVCVPHSVWFETRGEEESEEPE